MHTTFNMLRYSVGSFLLIVTALVFGGVPTTANPHDLHPGEFSWTPELAPQGPVAIIISLTEQRAYVYRNGTRIGISTVSTGKPGKETPVGIYAILQKKREHYSNLYDSAPMPYMQRLTWGGIALHAGRLPGYPASHGCVRLPAGFAQRLYATTAPGTIVVIADTTSAPLSVVSPGLFAPIDTATGSPRLALQASAGTVWFPAHSPEGPLTILLSTADQELVVLRNAIEIGRAPVALDPALGPIGRHAYMLLEPAHGASGKTVPLSLHWQALPTSKPAAEGITDDVLRSAFESGRIAVSEEFRQAVRAALKPGTTLILTDEPLGLRGDSIDVLSTDTADPE